jgi:hypothetical protein
MQRGWLLTVPHPTLQLIYGSADGGKTVYNRYKEMSALMKKAGRALNIKSHWIIPMDKAWRERRGVAQVQICGPGDIGTRHPHHAVSGPSAY